MTAKDWKISIIEGAWKNGPWFVLFLATVVPFSYVTGRGMVALVDRYVRQSEENNAAIYAGVKANGEQIAATLKIMIEAKAMMAEAPAWHATTQKLLQELIDEVRKNGQSFQGPRPGDVSRS